MITITVEEMQQDLRGYLRQVREGTSLVILEAHQPVAELKPVASPPLARGEQAGEPHAEGAPGELGDREVGRLEAEIDQLYGEIRDLMARSADEPAVGAQIEQKRQRQRALQEREAELLERRAAARLRFDPGQGDRLLTRAAALLER